MTDKIEIGRILGTEPMELTEEDITTLIAHLRSKRRDFQFNGREKATKATTGIDLGAVLAKLKAEKASK